MMAAITAKQKNKDAKIIVLEKLGVPGKKLGATGNGKCNISNIKCEHHEAVLNVFKGLGIITRTDKAGRIYPCSEDAKDVVRALVLSMDRLGIRVKYSSPVSHVEKNKEDFEIYIEKGDRIKSKSLLIAAGGKAGSKFGTTGDGTRIAKSLGHSITRLVPSLTAVELKEELGFLAGVREKCEISLWYEEKLIRKECGEVQFTGYGISGICVFNISKYIVIPEGVPLKSGFEKYRIKIDFLPEIDNLEEVLENRSFKLQDNYLISLVKRALAEYIKEKSGKDISKAAKMLKSFTLTPKNLRSWEFAQVTSGGVDYGEVNTETMESDLVRGLYFAGEVLDYDGLCGGYNLQHAFETGIRAGQNMGRI